MNKLNFFRIMRVALSCALMLGFLSCGDDNEDTGDKYLTVGLTSGGVAPDIYTLSNRGGTLSFLVKSNTSWTVAVKDAAPWVTINPASGENDRMVSIIIAASDNEDIRSIEVAFYMKDTEVKAFTFNQDPMPSDKVVHTSPSEGESFNNALNGHITFTWMGANIAGYYLVMSTASDYSNPLVSIPVSTLTANVSTTLLDEAMAQAGIAYDSETTLYWTAIPQSEDERPSDTPGTVKVKRVGAPVADMLDVLFKDDGTAQDISPLKNVVQYIHEDHFATFAYNATYKRNEVQFNGMNDATNYTATVGNKGTYYRVDYIGNTDFKNKLADGHSFECVVKFDVDYRAKNRTWETKYFSSQEGGGVGLVIVSNTNAAGPNGITFAPNVNTANSSKYIYAGSTVTPDGASYYHIVGVYDKANAKANVYVDGVLYGSVAAPGSLFLAPKETNHWIAIGGDAGDYCQLPYKGKMVIARVYDRALTQAEVTQLYTALGQ